MQSDKLHSDDTNLSRMPEELTEVLKLEPLSDLFAGLKTPKWRRELFWEMIPTTNIIAP